MSTIKSIKVILTKAGTEYDATKEYKLHDYIVVGGSVMYICKRVDADTMVCKGHSLDETEWWDKSVDLSDVEGNVTTAVNANVDTKVATAVSEKYDALVWRGTLDEYNALTDKTAYTLYLIMEEEA